MDEAKEGAAVIEAIQTDLALSVSPGMLTSVGEEFVEGSGDLVHALAALPEGETAYLSDTWSDELSGQTIHLSEDDLDEFRTNQDGQVMTVTGWRIGGGVHWSGGSDYSGHEPHPTLSPDPGGGPEPADHEVMKIEILFEPTEEQRKVIEALKEAIGRADKAISALPDNAKIRLSDGSTVSGKELKEVWAKTDFVLHPPGYNGYENQSGRGEAKYNGGDPIIAQNVDNVDGYLQRGLAGMNYLVLHEVAHLTDSNRDADKRSRNPQSFIEQMANDIARAIAHHGSIDMLSAEVLEVNGYGYGTVDPLVFSTDGS
jgi:hypothetical protein